MLIVDQHQAKLVVQRVDAAYKCREGLLEETGDLVENQIPEGVDFLSREHALFLFYTVVNDYSMKSSRLYTQAKALFSERCELFDPFYIVSEFSGPGDELIEATGRQLGTRYPKETAKRWYLNSVKLIAEFDGDPRKLYQSSSEAPKLMKNITAFRGYGPKIGGILLRAIIGLGFAKATGLEEVLVPVDIHDSRISFLTGILRVEDESKDEKVNYYAYACKVQKIFLDTCNSLGIEWLDMDRALWLIGSRGCVNKRCVACPLNDICQIGKQVLNRPLQRRLFEQST